MDRLIVVVLIAKPNDTLTKYGSNDAALAKKDLIMKTTLFERQNVGTIGEHNDDDNGHGMAVMMIMTNVRKSGFK